MAAPGMRGGPARLEFLGAAAEVTGSCFHLVARGGECLVDCGLFQGGREADAKNAAVPAFDVSRPDFVVLTHAHIDHSGMLPRLCARGYRGPIYATPATIDLVGVMLPDRAHIQEKDAEWSRDRRSRRAHGAAALEADAELQPLYTVAEAEACLRQFVAAPYGTVVEPRPGLRFRLADAGHILGSAIVEMWIATAHGERKLVFSGDLGQPGRPIMVDPARIADADVVVVESTYGDRLHKTLASTYEELARVLGSTLPHGNVLIPSFAVGRTQEVLFVLADLVRQGRAPGLTIFVDSPLAVRATEITAKYAATLDRESRELNAWLAQHRDRVRVHFTETAQDSMAINRISRGAVIVAASGMCEGGRIRHHLRHNLARAQCALVFTGFQARGTLGRQIVDGATRVHLFREDIPVRASIHTIGGLSAHADQQALLDWLRGFARPPAHTYVVHGEHETASRFAELVRQRLGWTAVGVPQHGTRVDIG
jgi:metallo-beta-lactamase family protein